MNTQRYETKTGVYWLPADAPEDVIIQAILDDRIFERQMYEAVQKDIKPGSTVIDVGPCYGQMSVQFARDARQVIAIEASPQMHSLCKKNFEENQVKNVRLIHAAAWDKAGETVKFMDYDFSHYKSYGCFGVDPLGRGKVEIDTITIDSLDIQESVSAIKIDAQGADLKVMKGAEQTIKKNQCTVLFEYEVKYDGPFQSKWSDYEDFFSRIEYKIHNKINNWNIIIKPE